MGLARLSQMAVRQSTNKWLHLGVGAAISAGLAYLVAYSLAWHEVIKAFTSFPISAALVGLLPLTAAMLFRAARWRVLLQGEPAKFTQILLTQNTGIGVNNLSPIRMVSEPVQLVLITRRYNVPFPIALTTLVGGNVLDIFATALLMGIGVLAVPGLRQGAISIQLFGAVVMLVVSVLVLIAVARGLHGIPFAGRIRFFHQVVLALGQLRDRPLLLWASFAATVAHWFALGLAGWVLAEAMAIDVSPLTMATILAAATFFTSAVPSAPAGVGTYHFAVVTMLTSLGVDPAGAFSFAVIMHLMFVLPPLLIALGMIGRVGLGFLLRQTEGPVDPKYRAAPSGGAHDADRR